LEAYWRSVVAAGEAGEHEARLRRFDGAYRWFLFRYEPLRQKSGTIVKWYGTNTDIDDRKRTEEALRASEQLARGQVEAVTRTLEALALESSPDKLLEHVLRIITKQLNAHSICVWQRNEASGLPGEEYSFEGNGPTGGTGANNRVKRLSVPAQDNILWEEIVRTKKPIVCEEVGRAGSALREHLLAVGVVSLFVVPMLIEGRVAGMIGVRSGQKRSFKPEEIELAQMLAHQAMLAIRLTRLSVQSRQMAVVAERNRMARDIHDALAEGFTGVLMQLEAAKGAVAHGDLAHLTEHIERACDLARFGFTEARRSVHALRPRALRDGTLRMALRDLLKRMTDGTELSAELQVEGDELAMATDREEGILRIAQESLANTIQHAKARKFSATLSFGREGTQLRFVDDGRGFDPQQDHEGFGLVGMKERVDRMGGRFILRSKVGEGTEVIVILETPMISDPENRNEPV
jgi:signal transduction histidine kinase